VKGGPCFFSGSLPVRLKSNVSFSAVPFNPVPVEGFQIPEDHPEKFFSFRLENLNDPSVNPLFLPHQL
jgi:hypothetical protein